VLLGGARADAQTRKPQPAAKPQRPFVERGFVTFAAGAQRAPGELSDRATFEANAETGSFDAGYGVTTGLVIDATAGFRVRRQLGIAIGVSRATRTGIASVSADVPHPFFDNRDRRVQGEAADMSRTETGVHFQVYYDLRPRGAWRFRLFAGPSYVDVEQELVTEVHAIEIFPFDTAEFGSVTTGRVSGSGIGFNGGIDAVRQLTRRIGAGGVVRYAGGSVDLDGPGSRGVSTDVGGLQAAVALRVLF
jgi:hypothetical protein